MIRGIRIRCPSEGHLRLAVDGPVEPRVAAHLARCARCQERLATLRENAAFVAERLVALTVDDQHAIHPPTLGPVVNRKETPMPRLRLVTASLATVLALALIVWLVPVGALADQLVQRFRVQQFAAITIPMDMLEVFRTRMESMPQEQRQSLAARFQEALQITPDQRTAQVREASSLDEVAAHLGRNPLVPGKLPEPFAGLPARYLVGEPQRREVTIDVAQTREALAQIGVNFASLPDPAVTPTVTIGLTIPASAAQVWQTADDQHLVVAELESPMLELPAEIDPELLREDLLMLPGLPPDVVAQIRAVRDWRETLIIPLPEQATSRQVTLRGTTGLLIESPEGSAVLWQERGILHVVGGSVSGEQSLAVARSLR